MSENHELFTQSGGKLLTFQLGEQEYGIQILEAREVVGVLPSDPIPNTPEFMKGVINLRGKIIPIIDLRLKFGMSSIETVMESCIIIVDIANQLTGVIVDSLIGVITIASEEFEGNLELGKNIRTDFMQGLAKLEEGRLITILNMQKILSHEELQEVHSAKPIEATTKLEEES